MTAVPLSQARLYAPSAWAGLAAELTDLSNRLKSAHPLALEEHCAAVQSTGHTQVLVNIAANAFVPDRVHLPNVPAPTWLRELDSPRSEYIVCGGKG